MRKVLIPFAVVILTSCGNNSSSSNTPAAPKENTEAATPADPEAEKGLDLIAKNDCLTCHKVADQLVGPAYEQVAERYKDSSAAIVDTLTHRVIRGSTGHWGEAQMTPHPAVPEADVRSMVKYVLSLKQ